MTQVGVWLQDVGLGAYVSSFKRMRFLLLLLFLVRMGQSPSILLLIGEQDRWTDAVYTRPRGPWKGWIGIKITAENPF